VLVVVPIAELDAEPDDGTVFKHATADLPVFEVVGGEPERIMLAAWRVHGANADVEEFTCRRSRRLG
jgi:hypothetical protein